MAIPKMTTDPYAVLGIPNDAAPAAIRSSYRKLILQCHPDKVHDETLREEKAIQFQKVQEAYELLVDSRRRRKYDEELVKQAKAAETAAKAPQPTHTTHPHSPNTHSQHPHGTRHTSGPVPGGVERSERPTRRERSGTNPLPDERQREKEKEREARHARKRAEGRERKPREEPPWSPEEQSPRKNSPADYPHWAEAEEARKAYEAHARHPDEVPKKGYNRYTEGSPRKHSYDSRQYESPKAPPMAPPPPISEVRPGYVEAKKAEEEKIAKLKARMAEETVHVPRPSVAEDNMRQQAAQAAHAEVLRAAAERIRLNKIEMERREKEMRERAEMRGSRDRDRGTEIPSHRERRSSKTPPMRRGSSVTSRCDEPPSTPMMRHQNCGSSAPSHPLYPGAHALNTGNYGIPRRRHSSPGSPGNEKQASHMSPREVPTQCDSGYSSPSTDTPVTDKKAPSPEMRTAAEGIDPGTGPWKKYTFEVYVREDAEAQAKAKGGFPSHHAHRQPESTSPSIHPADLSGGPPLPLPAEYLPKAVGIHGLPFPMYSPSSIHTHSPPSSHHPHSPHASPPRSHRHHHHSPNISPRLVSEQFSPGLSRANTAPYHSHSSHSREREHTYGGYVPSPGRSSTFSG